MRQARLRHYLTKCNIPSGYSGMPLPTAPPDVVDSRLDELGNGPDTNNLLLDWRHSMSSVWNSKVIVILAKGFIQDVGDCNQLPLTPEKCPSLDVIKKNCYKKLQALQDKYSWAIC